jgi:hypothetical protein
MADRAGPKPAPVASRMLQIPAWIAGAAFGAYAGPQMLIPAIASGILWWLLKRFLPEREKSFNAAVAIQGGHAIWSWAGFYYLISHGMLAASTAAFEGLLYLAALLLFAFVRSKVIVGLMMAYQAVYLMLNVAWLSMVAVGSFSSKALAAHVALRLLALFAMAILLWKTRRSVLVTRNEVAVFD